MRSRLEVSDTPDIMTPQQVADYLQVHIKTVYDWINGRDLKASKLGPRSLRIRREDIDNFLESKLFIPDGEMTLEQAANYLQVGSEVVQGLIDDGSLNALRYGSGQLTIKKADIDNLLETDTRTASRILSERRATEDGMQGSQVTTTKRTKVPVSGTGNLDSGF